VRGFNEQGTTTTPFDMVVLNGMSRYHLASLAVKFSRVPTERVAALRSELSARVDDSVRYTREHFEDPPDVRDWTWRDE
jgi:xylulose-5-phosphate/fructose-6-phosphate phosphoketolase